MKTKRLFICLFSVTDNQAWTILSQGSFQVLVNEGTTYDPVNLSCGFRDPFGGTIIITDTVH